MAQPSRAIFIQFDRCNVTALLTVCVSCCSAKLFADVPGASDMPWNAWSGQYCASSIWKVMPKLRTLVIVTRQIRAYGKSKDVNFS